MGLILFIALLFLSAAPQLSVQQTGEATLTIRPQSAVRGAPVVFECSTTAAVPNIAVSYFFLTRTKNGVVDDVVKFDQKCSEFTELKRSLEKEFQAATVTPNGCYSITVSNVFASDQTAAEYRCAFHLISGDFSKTSVNSQYVRLTVGDDTPEVSQLEVRKIGEINPLADNGEVSAGVNVSITCTARTAQPVPQYTIKAGDQALVTKTPAAEDNGRVTFVYLVPKQTSVIIGCYLHNGFGTEKSKQITIVPAYGASHSAIEFPDKVTQTTEEIRICSLANNPAKPLVVTLKDSASLLQAGYPRYEAKDGLSQAFIKLKDSSGAASANPTELTVTCGLEGGAEAPVSRTIQIVGVEASTQAPNSAMITIGIVIAVVVIFIVIVSAVGICLKRRNSTPKNGPGDKRYDKVGQNDAERRGPAARKLDDMPSTAV